MDRKERHGGGGGDVVEVKEAKITTRKLGEAKHGCGGSQDLSRGKFESRWK